MKTFTDTKVKRIKIEKQGQRARVHYVEEAILEWHKDGEELVIKINSDEGNK